ncbi:hypothetical protein NT01CX_1436 [Clostridium novyi NT]|uniref:Uncharacterized protein n=1 Tax=Clostridium novyi (strain NT) TaxID=386415 RepID=A0PYR5_CLONN|nr:hypothetical protein NT01CX_1436 [Clostridium novyi NT]
MLYKKVNELKNIKSIVFRGGIYNEKGRINNWGT